MSWPASPLVLRWSSVSYAAEYYVWVATDPALSNLVWGSVSSPVATQGTVAAFPTALAPGTYYWAITPVDAEGDTGPRSQIASFVWTWPSTTTPSESNISTASDVFDPQLSWNSIPGSASYQVEVNTAATFALGSKICCTDTVIGTSLSPTRFLANNQTLYWRMRAIDVRGDAGAWNYGPSFTQTFDTSPPTIAGLTLNDIQNGAVTPVAPGSATATPVITWNPVPGASSYEIQLAAYVTISGFSYCDWANLEDISTATTAWTPLARGAQRIGPVEWPNPETQHSDPAAGGTYCFQILARRDDGSLGGGKIISAWTQLGGSNQPAFTFSATALGTPGNPFVLPSNSYLSPASASLVVRTPLFTWNPVPGAAGYYVVVARDPAFTDVIDVGFTNETAYAPRIANAAPYSDQTTYYYWLVIPNTDPQGKGYSDMTLSDWYPQLFTKSSVPPTPLTPVNGSVVPTVPVFHWSGAELAKNYTIEVAADPTFGSPLVNVTTDSTSYTSEVSLPADTTLYWRVRGNDVIGQGLNWSPVSTFTHHLPAPSPGPGNATGGEAITAFSWTPIDGATAYDFHVDQPDGTTKNFTVQAADLSPAFWWGTGVWSWQVRADFPGGVSSAYFSPEMRYVREISAPAGVNATKSRARIVISWAPDPFAKRYRVELSTTDGFASTIDSQTTDNSVWVPQIPPAKAAQTLYWRVAAIDHGGEIGAYDSGVFHAPRRPGRRHCVRHKQRRCVRWKG